MEWCSRAKCVRFFNLLALWLRPSLLSRRPAIDRYRPPSRWPAFCCSPTRGRPVGRGSRPTPVGDHGGRGWWREPCRVPRDVGDSCHGGPCSWAGGSGGGAADGVRVSSRARLAGRSACGGQAPCAVLHVIGVSFVRRVWWCAHCEPRLRPAPGPCSTSSHSIAIVCDRPMPQKDEVRWVSSGNRASDHPSRASVSPQDPDWVSCRTLGDEGGGHECSSFTPSCLRDPVRAGLVLVGAEDYRGTRSVRSCGGGHRRRGLDPQRSSRPRHPLARATRP